MISFCRCGTSSSGTSTPRSPRATITASTVGQDAGQVRHDSCRSSLATSGMSAPCSARTGATSRYIGYACAAILIAMAFVPKIAAAFLAIPLSVAGGMLVFTGALMIAGGIQIMVSRNIDTRMTFVIGISLLLALSRKVFPAYFEELPSYLHSLAASSLALGIAAAVGLTLLFGSGSAATRPSFPRSPTTRSRTSRRFYARGASPGKSIRMSSSGRLRARLRPSCTSRTHTCSRGRSPWRPPTTTSISWSSSDRRGSLLSLPDLTGMSRDFNEEESFSYGLTLFLSGVYADRVEASSKGRLARIRLYFAT